MKSNYFILPRAALKKNNTPLLEHRESMQYSFNPLYIHSVELYQLKKKKRCNLTKGFLLMSMRVGDKKTNHKTIMIWEECFHHTSTLQLKQHRKGEHLQTKHAYSREEKKITFEITSNLTTEPACWRYYKKQWVYRSLMKSSVVKNNK